jgi:indole-3-glycerol phosphate synthase
VNEREYRKGRNDSDAREAANRRAPGGDGPGFLDRMAASSAARVAAARAIADDATVRARAADTAPPPRLRLSAAGFDLVAELKLRSPALGQLRGDAGDLASRVATYARGGAAAVSVLTEPEHFDGDLAHLAHAAKVLAPLGVPAMRKDFVVDAYQLYEARAHGAGGVLLIVTMLECVRLLELIDCAAELGLFVLLETFDAADVAVAHELCARWRGAPRACLVGVNSRNLQTLQVVPERLEELAPALPRRFPRVAESGLVVPADAARLARAGYDLALVGTALMTAEDPGSLARAMIAAGRSAACTARPERA